MINRRKLILTAATFATCSLPAIGREKENAMNEQDRNLQAVKIYNEAFNRGDVDALVQSFSEPTKNHGRVVPRAGIARVIQDIRTRFPDVNLSIDRMVATGDQVIVLQTYSGTHRGIGRLPVDGGLLVRVPPTGKHFSVPTHTLVHVERWSHHRPLRKPG